MRSKFARAAVVLSIFFAVGGCPPDPNTGGNTNANTGGGNGNSNGGGGNANNAGGNVGGGMLGPELNAAARTAVFDKIEQMLPTLRPDEIEATRTSLVSMLNDTADIAEAGANEDGSVWAIFSDGRPLLIALNNPMPFEALQAEEAAGVPSPRELPDFTPARPGPKPADPRSQSGDTGFGSIPSSRRVFLFNGFEDEPEVNRHIEALSDWLERRGYQDLTTDRLATIDNLMEVKDAGLLYINGHGGIGFIPVGPQGGPFVNVPIFALGTLTRRDKRGASDEQYRELLASQQIGYLAIPTVFGIPLSFGPRASSRYFVTRNFAFEHWTFSRGSWVYLDVCDGDDRIFKDACRDKGAGMFLSWDKTVRRTDSLETSQYLFSRVLGINDIFGAARVVAENPPQRAFDFGTIFRHMEITNRRNPHTFPGGRDALLESYSLHNPLFRERAELRLENLGQIQEALLAPGIQKVQTDDPAGVLSVLGSFGDDRGTVLVAGEPMVIEEWNSGFIRCQIPANATGAVNVVVNGCISDPRQLTVWRGTVSSTFSGANIPTETCELHIEFRGDAQSSRDLPGDTPKFSSGPGFECIPDASRVLLAREGGTLSCGQGVGGTSTVSTPDSATGLRYFRLGDNDDGFYFQRGTAQSDVEGLNADTGENEWFVTFGVQKADAVVDEIRCDNFRLDRRRRLDANGSFLAGFTVGSYNIFFNQTLPIMTPVGQQTLAVFADLQAVNTPSDDDPR